MEVEGKTNSLPKFQDTEVLWTQQNLKDGRGTWGNFRQIWNTWPTEKLMGRSVFLSPEFWPFVFPKPDPQFLASSLTQFTWTLYFQPNLACLPIFNCTNYVHSGVILVNILCSSSWKALLHQTKLHLRIILFSFLPNTYISSYTFLWSERPIKGIVYSSHLSFTARWEINFSC